MGCLHAGSGDVNLSFKGVCGKDENCSWSQWLPLEHAEQK